jgi:hypothetical protein
LYDVSKATADAIWSTIDDSSSRKGREKWGTRFQSFTHLR